MGLRAGIEGTCLHLARASTALPDPCRCASCWQTCPPQRRELPQTLGGAPPPQLRCAWEARVRGCEGRGRGLPSHPLPPLDQLGEGGLRPLPSTPPHACFPPYRLAPPRLLALQRTCLAQRFLRCAREARMCGAEGRGGAGSQAAPTQTKPTPTKPSLLPGRRGLRPLPSTPPHACFPPYRCCLAPPRLPQPMRRRCDGTHVVPRRCEWPPVRVGRKAAGAGRLRSEVAQNRGALRLQSAPGKPPLPRGPPSHGAAPLPRTALSPGCGGRQRGRPVWPSPARDHTCSHRTGQYRELAEVLPEAGRSSAAGPSSGKRRKKRASAEVPYLEPEGLEVGRGAALPPPALLCCRCRRCCGCCCCSTAAVLLRLPHCRCSACVAGHASLHWASRHHPSPCPVTAAAAPWQLQALLTCPGLCFALCM